MKTLVVWYSRTGTTAKVADDIARLTEWDRDEIIDRRQRRGLIGYVRSVYEARRGLSARIKAAAKDPSAYDLVVIGSPIWAGKVSSPVAAYLREHARQFKRVAFFVTYGGTGHHAVLAQMETLLGRPPVASLALRAGEVIAEEHRMPIRGFIDELHDQLGDVPIPAPVEPIGLHPLP